MIEGFLVGTITATSLTAGAFFLRFWRTTRDRLFLGFGAAFTIEGLNRALSVWLYPSSESDRLLVYGIRFVAFALILAAIIGKNASASHSTKPQGRSVR
jgi:hypothetical protein